MYEAKVIDTRAEGAPEYKVHYQGWNKKWDEWLAPSKIVRDTPENRTAMEAANEAARAAASGAAPSGKSRRRRQVQGTPRERRRRAQAEEGQDGEARRQGQGH